jgi:dTMP kinase
VDQRAGKFIVLEGPDGSGKTTVMEALVAHLDEKGKPSLLVREPGGTLVGERIREVLLEPDTQLAVETELFLYMAARSELARRVIWPALADGMIVLSQRWLYSSIVYQGLAGGLGADLVEDMGHLATDDVEPDLVCVLMVEAETGLARVGAQPDRMEAKGLGFHRRVVEGYRQLAGRGGTFRAVDATRPLEQVVADVVKEVDRVLE